MINKHIHLCWFGKNPYPKIMQNCLDSLQKFAPDYQITIWNEDNFNIESYPFAKQAYSVAKYAFVSDVCRLHVLKHHGGIYLDTDTEIVQNLDIFLENDFFMGFESDNLLSTAIIASCKNHPTLDLFLDYYNNKSFFRKHLFKKYSITPNTIIITNILKKQGLLLNNQYQNLPNKVTIYPKNYFSPIDYKTKVSVADKQTYVYHYFSESWKQNLRPTVYKIEK
ncbi:glycosyltransferase family 32 protein [Myroides sp. LJL119]